ncbi:DUF4422 domain-containing protein [Halanaerobium hydrogeniformans]|uniref:Exopolysaccharide biosynthesis protein n=1 Tax=Halanaerobium hydrogeniformans TaxID=656519 RepID=E4RM04_HALHG|nr:DUF4422 domain-containing protein [Halanaerobium hydrogeniformans]ADQ14087.1 exopolysaccharide biosynthesis protein [Halanaerobium hydrogeniformans]
MYSINKKVKIINVFHKKYYQFDNDLYFKIQAGSALSKENLAMYKDNSGDNISNKNPYYSELTAQYWFWKNYNYSNLDYIGLCHYRRYFAFLNAKNKIKKNIKYLKFIVKKYFLKNNLTFSYFPTLYLNYDEADKELENFNDQIIDQLPTFDIFLPYKVIFSNFNIEEQYIYSHIYQDFEIIKEVLLRKNKNYQESMETVLNQNKFLAYNMFIMRKDIFVEYNKWLFNILFEIEKKAKISKYNYQARLLAFAAERLFNIYIHKLKQDKTIKIKYLDTIFIKEKNK